MTSNLSYGSNGIKLASELLLYHQFLQHAWHRFAVEYIPLHGGLELCQRRFDVIVATHKTIDLVVQTQVYKLKREMRTGSRA